MKTHSPSYHRELLWNQIWQGLNFFSKFGLLFLLTPLMLRCWGEEEYGLFALSSSLLVSLAVLDFGVRSSTRLNLCSVRDETGAILHLRRGTHAFGTVSGIALLAALLFSAWSGWTRLFNLPPGGNTVMMVTAVLVVTFMMSGIFLEPIAAAGRLSDLKKANTVGASLAIPVLTLWILLGGGVLGAVLLYFAALIGANLWLIAASPFPWRRWFPQLLQPCPWKEIRTTLRQGGWFYATTLALIAKTHALTFFVAHLLGAAEAGIFYILLRMTEVVAVLGTTSSDTNLAALASAKTPAERFARFQQSYRYALLFSLHGCAGLAILTTPFLKLWLPHVTNIPSPIGVALAVFGLGGAFSRVVVNSAMGLGAIRTAALGNLTEAALILGGAAALLSYGGLRGLFFGGGLAALALIPAAREIARRIGRSPFDVWVEPVNGFLPFLGLNLLFFTAGAISGHWIGFLGACIAGGIVALHEWRRLHRLPPDR